MLAEKWNSGWKFWEDRDAFNLVWNIPEDAEEIDLPHDAILEKPAYVESPNGGNTSYRVGGSYVYTWTGWDYLGEAGVGVPAYWFGGGGFGAQFPCQVACVGDLDINGFRRPVSFFREIDFGLRKAPYMRCRILPSMGNA